MTEENLKKVGVAPAAAQTLARANENVVAQSGLLAGTKSYGGGTAVVASPTLSAGDISLSVAEPVSGTVSGPAVVTAPVASSAPVGRIIGKSYGGASAATTEEALLAGFGNNGGEEFLSYMLASESMVILGEKEWNNWFDKMGGRLSKVQNPDGSWSGHHCITSPVFCTAAVVQTMTADRDAEMLARVAKEAGALAKVEVKP